MITISGNDFVKYMTQKVVTFMDSSPEQRKARKGKQVKQEPAIYSNRWFGILPFAVKMFMKKAD
ncbi:YqzE family protein [Virgibacillus sp. FSP13]